MNKLKDELRSRLPHRYLFPRYTWGDAFFNNCTHKMQFLKGCNQVGKSSAGITKCIEWATNQKLWEKLWPKTVLAGAKPDLFWYLYPDSVTTAAEVSTKWAQFLPKFKWDEHPVYGWRFIPKTRTGGFTVIEFRTGIQVWFKYYSQDVENLQSSSVFAIFCDEEIDPDLMPEVTSRTNATDGYFHMVWTPTANHEHWRLTMEPREDEADISPYRGSWKRNFTLYDCVKYADGSASPWTIERIKQTEAKYPSKEEVDRRVHGRCVTMQSERVVPTFNSKTCRIPPFLLPRSWLVYAALDHGKGVSSQRKGAAFYQIKKVNGKSAVVFLAVSPDYSRGVVFKAWRGDDVETEAADTLDKFVEMRGSMVMANACYDGAAYDLGTIARRAGIPLEAAKKDRKKGYDLLRSLFSARMLHVFEGDDELTKLSVELENLLDIDKQQPDDLVDALRYAVMMVPWDFSRISEHTTVKVDPLLEKPEAAKVLSEREASAAYTVGRMSAGDFEEQYGRREEDDISWWASLYD